MYDFIVVGGGIAGVCVSEILQRSGRAVLLLEAREIVCAEDSARQVGWFHTGALYAALPDKSFLMTLVRNLDFLQQYYAGFENMNLTPGRNEAVVSHTGWFSCNRVLHIYTPPASREVDVWRKALWWLATQIARRRFARSVRLCGGVPLGRKPTPNEWNGLPEGVKRLGASSSSFLSHDGTMDSRLINTDLIRSFLGHGGDLRINSEVISINHGYVATTAGAFQSRKVIVTAGKRAKDLTGLGIKTVVSPIAVAYPALTMVNFVRMTPRISRTINHTFQQREGLQYSTVGNGSYYTQVDTHLARQIEDSLRDRILSVFPECNARLGVYFGSKTEVVGHGQLRNYLYHILETDDCTVALPGKYCLSFSLAINICKYFGIDPCTGIQHLADSDEVKKYIPYPEHYQIALNLRGSPGV